jgi:polysaccharide biosynthesis/export protein ExoF
MAQELTEIPKNRWTLARWRGLWLAVMLVAAPPMQAGAQQTEHSFADGDVLKITAYGREDLTGQYSVQPGPVLSLPLIGTVELENRTARQLETELAAAWENRLGTPMSVTIEFSQRAPFYVIGAVSSPGAYPYRTGMTVLQAVAVSGGIQKQIGSTDERMRIDILREQERRMQAIERLAQAQARRARLLAEREGRAEITLEQPFNLVPKERMDRLLAEESRLLDARMKQHTLKERLLADQIRLGEAEIASYQQQHDTMTTQQEQIAKESTRIRRVPGQQVRIFELDQRTTTMETTKASLMASISRAKSGVETARNGIADLREARQREISESLLEAERAIKEGELTEAATRDMLAGTGQAGTAPALSFRLMRPGTAEIIAVQSSSVIRPGDLLEVGMSGAEGQPPLAGGQ